ncbi:unnamed protein product [Blepharisma stoltei]|uniref:RanBP2-type domain-containing protein n=1 Tax=Blepharisma stoltei TaxID=1481888 RepID=A0AAU9JEH2_9CILI|nr:unnamed protein product [Blepharisma stoltei]
MEHFDYKGMEVYTKFESYSQCIEPIPKSFDELCQSIMRCYRLESEKFEIHYEDDKLGEIAIDSDSAYVNAWYQCTGQGIYLIMNKKSASPGIPMNRESMPPSISMNRGPMPQCIPNNGGIPPINPNNLAQPYQQARNPNVISPTTLLPNISPYQPINNFGDPSRSVQVNGPYKPAQNPPQFANQNNMPQFPPQNNFGPSQFQPASPVHPTKFMNSPDISIPLNQSQNNLRNPTNSTPPIHPPSVQPPSIQPHLVKPPQLQPPQFQQPPFQQPPFQQPPFQQPPFQPPPNFANSQQTLPASPLIKNQAGSPGGPFQANKNQGISFPQGHSANQSLNLPSRNSFDQTIPNPRFIPPPPRFPNFCPSNDTSFHPRPPPNSGLFSQSDSQPNQGFSPNQLSHPSSFQHPNVNIQQTLPSGRNHNQNINSSGTQSLQIKVKCICGADKVFPKKKWRCDRCASLNDSSDKMCPICHLIRGDMESSCPNCHASYKV